MAWFERLIDLIPDSPQSVGACLSIAGGFGSLVGLFLEDTPLRVASFLVFAAGAIGPVLHALKEQKHAQPRTDMAEEDAAVDAFIRHMQARGEDRPARQGTLLSCSYQPGLDRLH